MVVPSGPRTPSPAPPAPAALDLPPDPDAPAPAPRAAVPQTPDARSLPRSSPPPYSADDLGRPRPRRRTESLTQDDERDLFDLSGRRTHNFFAPPTPFHDRDSVAYDEDLDEDVTMVGTADVLLEDHFPADHDDEQDAEVEEDQAFHHYPSPRPRHRGRRRSADSRSHRSSSRSRSPAPRRRSAEPHSPPRASRPPNPRSPSPEKSRSRSRSRTRSPSVARSRSGRPRSADSARRVEAAGLRLLSKSPSVDTLLLTPKLPKTRSGGKAPPPARSPQPQSTRLESDLSDSGDDYGKAQAFKERVEQKAVARGYEKPVSVEDEDMDDLQDFENEIAQEGFDDGDNGPSRKRKKRPTHPAKTVPSTTAASDADDSDQAATARRSKGKKKAVASTAGSDEESVITAAQPPKKQAKPRRPSRKATKKTVAPAYGVDTTDEEDAGGGDEDAYDEPGRHKSGAVPQDIVDRLVIALSVFEDKVVELAAECGKSPQTLHQLVGTAIKKPRDVSGWNVWQRWHSVERPKHADSKQPLFFDDDSRLTTHQCRRPNTINYLEAASNSRARTRGSARPTYRTATPSSRRCRGC